MVVAVVVVGWRANLGITRFGKLAFVAVTIGGINCLIVCDIGNARAGAIARLAGQEVVVGHTITAGV